MALGNFILRVPISTHQKLKELAYKEGVSLNMLVNTLIADSLGRLEETWKKHDKQ
jgi:HicB family.